MQRPRVGVPPTGRSAMQRPRVGAPPTGRASAHGSITHGKRAPAGGGEPPPPTGRSDQLTHIRPRLPTSARTKSRPPRVRPTSCMYEASVTANMGFRLPHSCAVSKEKIRKGPLVSMNCVSPSTSRAAPSPPIPHLRPTPPPPSFLPTPASPSQVLVDPPSLISALRQHSPAALHPHLPPPKPASPVRILTLSSLAIHPWPLEIHPYSPAALLSHLPPTHNLQAQSGS